MGTDKGYTGQFQDAVSGFDYYNARYYDPVMGQFLSADSVQGNAQGRDPYSYVNGNPETATDPTGQRISCPPDCDTSGGIPTAIHPGGSSPSPSPRPTPVSAPARTGCQISLCISHPKPVSKPKPTPKPTPTSKPKAKKRVTASAQGEITFEEFLPTADGDGIEEALTLDLFWRWGGGKLLVYVDLTPLIPLKTVTGALAFFPFWAMLVPGQGSASIVIPFTFTPDDGTSLLPGQTYSKKDVQTGVNSGVYMYVDKAGGTDVLGRPVYSPTDIGWTVLGSGA